MRRRLSLAFAALVAGLVFTAPALAEDRGDRIDRRLERRRE